jgi:hypothetical protein
VTEDTVVDEEIRLFMVANSRSVGGFKDIAPQASVSDGLFDVIIFKKMDLFQMFPLLFAVLSGFCFISFAQSDLMVTGNRSWLFYESGIRGFYGASFQWTGLLGANYMPTTFWLFALWNYPLKLLGFDMPAHADVSNLSYIMWYKLLPVLFYIASAYLLFVIARQIGMSKARAKVCMFSFLSMPLAFFSQLIFSQYDSFTVFFMLAGMLFYFREENGKRSWMDH